jgi:hypothetical protein
MLAAGAIGVGSLSDCLDIVFAVQDSRLCGRRRVGIIEGAIISAIQNFEQGEK